MNTLSIPINRINPTKKNEIIQYKKSSILLAITPKTKRLTEQNINLNAIKIIAFSDHNRSLIKIIKLFNILITFSLWIFEFLTTEFLLYIYKKEPPFIPLFEGFWRFFIVFVNKQKTLGYSLLLRRHNTPTFLDLETTNAKRNTLRWYYYINIFKIVN